MTREDEIEYLKFISDVEVEKGKSRGVYKCQCGNNFEAIKSNVKSGNTKRCRDCSNKSRANKATTHGGRFEKLHSVWSNMKDRCLNHNSDFYHRYGGRGITVCNEWNDYSAFRKWANSNGYSSELQIDRIDNDKGYSPDNCWFTTSNENMANTSLGIKNRFTNDELSEAIECFYNSDITKLELRIAMGVSNTAVDKLLREEY